MNDDNNKKKNAEEQFKEETKLSTGVKIFGVVLVLISVTYVVIHIVGFW